LLLLHNKHTVDGAADCSGAPYDGKIYLVIPMNVKP